MDTERWRNHFVPIFLVIMAVAVGACTRSVSTPPPTADSAPQATLELSGPQATMEAVRSTLLTQTAQAGEAGVIPTATATPETASETPGSNGDMETVVPTEGADITETVEPTVDTTPTGTTEYTVQSGEWVNSIAQKFNVDPDDIISLNDLQPPYSLEVGQVLLIPSADATSVPTTAATTAATSTGGQEYTVQSGEWVYSIARKFGVDPQAIIDLNNLPFPYTLYPGDVLIIP